MCYDGGGGRSVVIVMYLEIDIVIGLCDRLFKEKRDFLNIFITFDYKLK